MKSIAQNKNSKKNFFMFLDEQLTIKRKIYD